MMNFKTNSSETETPGPSDAQPSTWDENPYGQRQLERAGVCLRRDLESGPLRFLQMRNLLDCASGGRGWKQENLWEGFDGMMEHIEIPFPHPPIQSGGQSISEEGEVKGKEKQAET